jgi:hypothetical protein
MYVLFGIEGKMCLETVLFQFSHSMFDLISKLCTVEYIQIFVAFTMCIIVSV